MLPMQLQLSSKNNWNEDKSLIAQKENILNGTRKAYFIGIGGVGMSAVARVLKHQGLNVLGSDMRQSATTRALVSEGIPVQFDFCSSHLDGVDLIVYSSAIPKHDPAIQYAREHGIRTAHRAQVLASLLNTAQTSAGVLGTHGKTTTSSMISYILSELGRNPTCLVGGDILNRNTNTLLGSNGYWVAEVDESDRSHELYHLNYAVITNLEQDHVENYADMAAVEASFEKFLSHMHNPGFVVYNGEDAVCEKLVRQSGRASLSIGLDARYDFGAIDIRTTPFGSRFVLTEYGFPACEVELSLPGRHNISNALCAIALLSQMGQDLEDVCRTITGFRGARRRLEVKGISGETVVIDDYAHHPTEVAASLNALRQMGKKITIVFQPHRYSRTAFFYKEFAMALNGADRIVLTDIYSAGESNPDDIKVQMIYDELLKLQHKDAVVVSRDAILSHLHDHAHFNGVIAFLGAGNIGEVADACANCLKTAASA